MVTIKFEKGEWPLVLSDALLLTDEEAAMPAVGALIVIRGLSIGVGLVGNL